MTGLVSPSQAWEAGVAAGHWQDDPAQRALLFELTRIFVELLVVRRARRGLRRFFSPDSRVRGLYLWGGVGRGKTFLVDLLYASIPGRRARRVHFHHFMAEVHAALRELPDTPDPLDVVAERILTRTQVLVLDEFVVTDIGDAMILARLLEALFDRGLTLVTTSNTRPADLYRDGLQRARFLPAIALIESCCNVCELASGTDYRLRRLRQAPVYLHPHDARSEAMLGECFAQIAGNEEQQPGPLRLLDRDIAVRARAEGVVWFDFPGLCEGPRAVADYIEIARSFHTVLISAVPCFDGGNDDAARRFQHLVDEFYDRNVNLILSAACGALDLYRGERLRESFARTASRLIEMQSEEYLAREHRP